MGAIKKFNKFNEKIASTKIKDKKLYKSMMKDLLSNKNEIMMLMMNKKSHDLALPYITKILAQGKNEKVFLINNPKEKAEILYYNLQLFVEKCSRIILNGESRKTKEKEIRNKMKSYQIATKRMLGIKKYNLYIYSSKHFKDLLKFI